MRLLARAKINWALNVTGRRENGYHELDMLMQSVSLCDELTLAPDDGLSLADADTGAPLSEDNLVLRAARALMARANRPLGARMRLTKRIPSMAGLGGGSADCAAALTGLNRLWDLRLSPQALSAIGLSLGADVPFCLAGGLQRARGLGEQLTPLPGAAPKELLIVMPPRGLSPPQVFGAFDGMPASAPADIASAARALATEDAALLRQSARNMLQAPAQSLYPPIADMVRALYERGARFAAMSGSGSACFAWLDGPDADIEAAFPDCLFFRCHTESCGVCPADDA